MDRENSPARSDSSPENETPHEVGWRFDNSYARLPELLYSRATALRFPGPRLIRLNSSLADDLGLDFQGMDESSLARIFSGQELPPGAEPIAQAYAGHQFGGFTMLGDGRALLLGEQLARDGRRFDIQLKGSGPTPYSRRGDGLAALGPMLREYIISEAMHGLGIPTTRSLAVVTTGAPVYRERTLRGAVLTRVAASHIRVGTFQFVAARRDESALRQLADYTIARHFPEIEQAGLPVEAKYLEFFNEVCRRQARLVSRWQMVGFVHGVMNTDNVSLAGETIDYGPCAFMDSYHAHTVFSSIDEQGRYSYGNQPAIAQWNLARFAESLIPLLAAQPEAAVEIAKESLHQFAADYQEEWLAGMRAKLGLTTPREGDRELVSLLLEWMQDSAVDFTNTFDDLSTRGEFVASPYHDSRFQGWLTSWRKRIGLEQRVFEEAQAMMRQVNPALIPRNHRVEEALAAAESDDLRPFNELLVALRLPFERTESLARFREPGPAGACYRTFCGT